MVSLKKSKKKNHFTIPTELLRGTQKPSEPRFRTSRELSDVLSNQDHKISVDVMDFSGMDVHKRIKACYVLSHASTKGIEFLLGITSGSYGAALYSEAVRNHPDKQVVIVQPGAKRGKIEVNPIASDVPYGPQTVTLHLPTTKFLSATQIEKAWLTITEESKKPFLFPGYGDIMDSHGHNKLMEMILKREMNPSKVKEVTNLSHRENPYFFDPEKLAKYKAIFVQTGSGELYEGIRQTIDYIPREDEFDRPILVGVVPVGAKLDPYHAFKESDATKLTNPHNIDQYERIRKQAGPLEYFRAVDDDEIDTAFGVMGAKVCEREHPDMNCEPTGASSLAAFYEKTSEGGVRRARWNQEGNLSIPGTYELKGNQGQHPQRSSLKFMDGDNILLVNTGKAIPIEESEVPQLVREAATYNSHLSRRAA